MCVTEILVIHPLFANYRVAWNTTRANRLFVGFVQRISPDGLPKPQHLAVLFRALRSLLWVYPLLHQETTPLVFDLNMVRLSSYCLNDLVIDFGEARMNTIQVLVIYLEQYIRTVEAQWRHADKYFPATTLEALLRLQGSGKPKRVILEVPVRDRLCRPSHAGDLEKMAACLQHKFE